MCSLRNFVLKENSNTKCNRKQGLGVGLGFGVALAGPSAPKATPKPPCVPNLNHLCKNNVPLVAQKMSFGPLVLPRANPKPVRSFLRCSQVSRNLFEYMRPLLKDQNDPKESKQVSKSATPTHNRDRDCDPRQITRAKFKVLAD